MEVYTIGFTQRPAKEFFGALERAGIRRLVDVRLHNVGDRRSRSGARRVACGDDWPCDARIALYELDVALVRQNKGFERLASTVLFDARVAREFEPGIAITDDETDVGIGAPMPPARGVRRRRRPSRRA